jgi:hypothetical protein
VSGPTATSGWSLAAGRWRLAALAAGSWLLAAAPLAAQIDDVRISDTNGQMDFWLPSPKRPDTELTNAALGVLTLDGAPLWGRWVHVPACRVAAATQACATTELQLGQQMYTPADAFKTPEPVPGERPYAGWLYVSGTATVATALRSDALMVETGVTGTPSLAEKIQTAWHGIIGYPRVLGWSHQIPFEPGVLVALNHEQEWVHAALGDVPVLLVGPLAGVSLGNVLTGAHVGGEARIGYGVTAPWSSFVHGRGRKVEFYGVARAREDLVAYDLFLDRSTTRPTLHVDKEPLVFQYEFGFGARFGPFEGEYRAVTRGHEYTTGPLSHADAVIAAGVRPGW